MAISNNSSIDEIMERLKAPFPSNDIEWRVSRSGKKQSGTPWAMVLAYVDNRAIQNRLDEVFGPGGWKNEYRDFMGGVICTISCLINGQWVSKEDGAEKTQFESFKGGLSSAMKRAGSQWGIGRYLYDLEETFVQILPQKPSGSEGKRAIYINDKSNQIKGYWLPPQLPAWALPEEERGNLHGSGQNHQPNPPVDNFVSSQQSQQRAQQRPSSQNKNQNQYNSQHNQGNGEGFNRKKTASVISQMVKQTGLSQNPNWIMKLIKKALPNNQSPSLQDFYSEATAEEFKKVCAVLKPVSDLVVIAEHYKVRVEDVLSFAQILLPKITIHSLQNCFFVLTIEHVKEIHEMVKEEVQTGSLQQIA